MMMLAITLAGESDMMMTCLERICLLCNAVLQYLCRATGCYLLRYIVQQISIMLTCAHRRRSARFIDSSNDEKDLYV